MKLAFVSLLAVFSLLIKPEVDMLAASEAYMDEANKKKIKAGCFYIIKATNGADSLVITKKNF